MKLHKPLWKIDLVGYPRITLNLYESQEIFEDRQYRINAPTTKIFQTDFNSTEAPNTDLAGDSTFTG